MYHIHHIIYIIRYIHHIICILSYHTCPVISSINLMLVCRLLPFRTVIIRTNRISLFSFRNWRKGSGEWTHGGMGLVPYGCPNGNAKSTKCEAARKTFGKQSRENPENVSRVYCLSLLWTETDYPLCCCGHLLPLSITSFIYFSIRFFFSHLVFTSHHLHSPIFQKVGVNRISRFL